MRRPLSLLLLPLAARALAQAPACRATVLSDRLLRVDGREVYVEPQSVALSRGRLLVTGAPNYAWGSLGPDGWPTSQATDSVFGVIVEKGRDRFVPSPVKERELVDPRVVADGRGGWHAVFGEFDQPVPYPSTRTPAIRALWYGHFDGVRWSGLEKLADGSDALRLQPSRTSRLLARGDRLWIAVKYERYGARGKDSDGVLVLRRDGGRWRRAEYDVPQVGYVELAGGWRANPSLLVTHPDSHVVGQGGDGSIFAHPLPDSGALGPAAVVVANEGFEQAHFPAGVEEDGIPAVSYHAQMPGRQELRAARLTDGRARWVRLDPNVLFAATTRVGSRTVSIVSHVDTTRSPPFALRVLALDARGNVSSTPLPAPSDPPTLAVVPRGPDRIAVVLGRAVRDGAYGRPRTGLVELALRCADGVTRR